MGDGIKITIAVVSNWLSVTAVYLLLTSFQKIEKLNSLRPAGRVKYDRCEHRSKVDIESNSAIMFAIYPFIKWPVMRHSSEHISS